MLPKHGRYGAGRRWDVAPMLEFALCDNWAGSMSLPGQCGDVAGAAAD